MGRNVHRSWSRLANCYVTSDVTLLRQQLSFLNGSHCATMLHVLDVTIHHLRSPPAHSPRTPAINAAVSRSACGYDPWLTKSAGEESTNSLQLVCLELGLLRQPESPGLDLH
ncbi:hypothetical protein J6590_078025 [Homalodisca vitripennis]|nr:hypothetical protein J6590_078025 [Homalodisca vitripennis]